MNHLDDKFEYSFKQNRELSWMKFNERVLEEAQDETVPLIERLKFISIFTSNFDEFFMIRVGNLTDLAVMEGNNYDSKTGMTPQQQLDKIFVNSVPIYKLRDKVFKEIEQKLRNYGIFNLQVDELDKAEKRFLDRYYESYILPILSPQVIDSHHPFPHLINKAQYIICEFLAEETDNKNQIETTSVNKVGLIPISLSFPEFVLLPGSQTRYVLTENLVIDHIEDIFSMYKVKSATIISVTRNADINPQKEITEENSDYREKMKKVIKKRARLSPVRLEILGKINLSLLNFLMEKLEIEEKQVFYSNVPLLMNYVTKLTDKLPTMIKKQLSYQPFEASCPSNININESITTQCKSKDIILYYPYHKMEPFLRLLKESAEDPSVISIKITIYRLSKHSRIIDYLCNAAENNKEVTVLIELKARFDEKNNIEWAERLEQSGCNVIYGFEGYKVHSKICLITRRERNKIVYITQVGTGNYNEKTASKYSDLSLITANQEIGQDAFEFFKNMSISNLKGNYRHLIVAPFYYKYWLINRIEQEIKKVKSGLHARIIIKVNSFTDIDVINKLSEASIAGVKITLIIRGICCLLPGVKGKTENINVISIVGRFLEHSRLYCFGVDGDMDLYIASADMMTRNTIRRVEVLCPVLDRDVKNDILHLLDVMIADNVKARVLQPDGSYKKIEHDSENSIDSQQYFINEINSPNIQHSKPKWFFDKLKNLIFD